MIAARIAPSYQLNDGGYMYMEGVKVHEFYHNINGSQVTGLSPFQIWLNEAVTVHIQRKREHVLFGEDFRNVSATGVFSQQSLFDFVFIDPGRDRLESDTGVRQHLLTCLAGGGENNCLGFGRSHEMSVFSEDSPSEFRRSRLAA